MKRDKIGLDFAVKAKYKYIEYWPDTGIITSWARTRHELVAHKSRVETKIATVRQYSKLTEGELS